MATAVAIDESRNGKVNSLQLVQVEGFLEVARRGSVSRAAEALFITQPTLTARLHGLERELGTPLFLRTPHGMRLTDAGKAWVPYAERALRALAEGRDALEQVKSASAGHLMIAAPNDGLFGRLCGVLGHPEWAADPRFAHNPDRVAHREELTALIGAATAERAMEGARMIGRTPVLLRKEIPGFIVNRILHMATQEAYRLLDGGVADSARTVVVGTAAEEDLRMRHRGSAGGGDRGGASGQPPG